MQTEQQTQTIPTTSTEAARVWLYRTVQALVDQPHDVAVTAITGTASDVYEVKVAPY